MCALAGNFCYALATVLHGIEALGIDAADAAPLIGVTSIAIGPSASR
jgi:hypothetical protein